MDARQFLMRFLASGMRSLPDVKAAARDAGIPWSTAKRAKKLLGIETVRRGKTIIGWQMPPKAHGARVYPELKKAREEAKKIRESIAEKRVELSAAEERIRLLENVIRLSARQPR